MATDSTQFRGLNFSESSGLVIGSAGWVMYFNDEVGDDFLAWIRFADHLGVRLIATELVAKSFRLTGRTLDEIQLGKIEEAVNEPATASYVRSHLAEPGSPDDWSPWARVHQAFFVVAPSERPDQPFTDEDPPGPLIVPAGHRRPDSFYADVASAYTYYASRSSKPAADLAGVNEVPVSTAHRWIKEARARGLLAPSARAVQPTLADAIWGPLDEEPEEQP